MRKDTAKNLVKIINCLKTAEEGWIWFIEISRRTKLHHKTVSRLINRYLSMFVEIQPVEPFNLKMVRLRKDVDVNGILRYLELKERLED